MNSWKLYIEYLEKWAKEHKDIKFMGMCPVCFEEFLENDIEVQ